MGKMEEMEKWSQSLGEKKKERKEFGEKLFCAWNFLGFFPFGRITAGTGYGNWVTFGSPWKLSPRGCYCIFAPNTEYIHTTYGTLELTEQLTEELTEEHGLGLPADHLRSDIFT